ncbi:MAG TPA: glycosyltransferase [Beijerinckia sp.]|nr:glycosyltransferase [Beijerinckia sp.]
MRVAVLTMGSRGDVQPPAALAQALAARGHQVSFITNEGFGDLVDGLGFQYKPLTPDIRAEFRGEAGALLANSRNPVVGFRAISDIMKRHTLSWARQIKEHAAGSDLAVGVGMGSYSASLLGQFWNIPFVQAYLQPMLATRAFPSPIFPRLPFRLPGWLNRLEHQAVLQVMWLLFRPLMSESLAEVWHAPPAPIIPPWHRFRREGRPVVMAYSRHVLPQPMDWEEAIDVTGYWFLDRPAGWTPPQDLARFIENGPPPVYIGFGSMVMKDPAKTVGTVMAAVRQVGCRAVISAGWGGLRPADLAEDVMPIDSIPHDWLFPRMAAIVHHGGSGTTAAALRAGRPSIVVPFLADQPFWGERLKKLGVAPSPISHSKLTADALAAAISRALRDTDMQAKAKVLGRHIAEENGLERAVARIEAVAVNR